MLVEGSHDAPVDPRQPSRARLDENVPRMKVPVEVAGDQGGLLESQQHRLQERARVEARPEQRLMVIEREPVDLLHGEDVGVAAELLGDDDVNGTDPMEECPRPGGLCGFDTQVRLSTDRGGELLQQFRGACEPGARHHLLHVREDRSEHGEIELDLLLDPRAQHLHHARAPVDPGVVDLCQRGRSEGLLIEIPEAISERALRPAECDVAAEGRHGVQQTSE